MADSQQLLSGYLDGRESAFRELVARYVNLVYSAAVRLSDGDTHLAEDVTQTVFADLARMAPKLSPSVMLGGWLHRHTCYVAAKVMRGERRRQAREIEALKMNAIHDHTEANLQAVQPFLDEAINALGTEDRAAILLRFFEQQDFRTVGTALGSSEEAARKRVARALEKLEALLKRRGVAFPVTTLGTTLAASVTAAPAGLAASVGATALSTAAATSGMTWGLLKIITMSKLKLAMAGALIVVGVGTPLWIKQGAEKQLAEKDRRLRQQVEQLARLASENERLSALAGSLATMSPRLPAPRLDAAPVSAEPPAEEVKPPSIIARLLNGGEPPRLTPEQLESYLTENRRTAASLLAAFRATGDANLLREAMDKFPTDPQVAFAAAFQKDSSPEDRRRWLEAFKQFAPGNALANYLLAADLFKTGQADEAVRELVAAAGKPHFQDYSSEFVQNDEEVWRSSGYSVAESKTLASMLLVLPHLGQLKGLSQDMVSLANSYRAAGDEASAHAALRLGVNLGERLDGSPGQALITQLVGMAIQGIALRGMDPLGTDGNGRVVQERLDDLARERAAIRSLAAGFDEMQHRVSEQDWISYKDRWRSFGEMEALRWLTSKYGPEKAATASANP